MMLRIYSRLSWRKCRITRKSRKRC